MLCPKIRSREQTMRTTNRRILVWLFVLPVLYSGCLPKIGSKAVRRERFDYNQEIVRSSNEQMLLNIVRLRYGDTPYFLELTSVVTQYGIEGDVAVGGQITSPANSLDLGTAVSVSEHPTLTYAPLSGEQMATNMLAPLPLGAIMLFLQSGWHMDRLLVVCMARINDVYNATVGTAPNPDTKPDFQEFLAVAHAFRRLQVAGLIGLNWEHTAKDRIPHFWLKAPSNPSSPYTADIAFIKKSLGLPADEMTFDLTAFPYDRKPNEVGMRTRSLLGILYFLGESIEVPAEHLQARLAVLSTETGGQPSDWSILLDNIMRIHAQKEKPANAAAAVHYRDYWFYIADDDSHSKATFSLVNYLYFLQSASSEGKTPLITLPVGR